MTLFNKLHQHYKDTWDKEMAMEKTGTTYAKAAQLAFKEDDWF